MPRFRDDASRPRPPSGSRPLPLDPRRLAVPLTAAVACGLTGCLFVSADRPPLGSVAGSAAKPMPRTVAIEALFIRFAEDEAAEVEAIWNEVDEQAVDPSLRTTLAAHGMRAGVAPTLLPEAARRKIEDAQAEAVAGREPTTADEQIVVRRVLRLLPGREGRLVTRAAVPELIVFERSHGDGGEGRVLGRTFRDATSELLLSAMPAADGRARVAVVPAIEHGPQRRSWKGEEGVFRLEAGQARHVFDSLRIEVELPHDHVLVVGSHGIPGSSVASAILQEPTTGQRRIVVLRPLSRTLDPLFDGPGQDGESLPAKSLQKGR